MSVQRVIHIKILFRWNASKCTDYKRFICQTKATTSVTKNNKKKKNHSRKKTDAEIVVKVDSKINNTNDVDYKFRSGIETFVHIPRRVWNKYPQKKPLKPIYYPRVAAISSRYKD